MLWGTRYFTVWFLSLDGKEYDPSDFDFVKVDDDEKKRDALVAAEQGVQSFYDVNNMGMAGMAQPLANSYPGQPMVGVKSVQQSMSSLLCFNLIISFAISITCTEHSVWIELFIFKPS